MVVTGELTFTSVKTGISKKSDKPYRLARFLDSDAEEFVSFFINEELYRALEEIPPHTPVLLTLSIAVQSKYFQLVSVEPIVTD